MTIQDAFKHFRQPIDGLDTGPFTYFQAGYRARLAETLELPFEWLQGAVWLLDLLPDAVAVWCVDEEATDWDLESGVGTFARFGSQVRDASVVRARAIWAGEHAAPPSGVRYVRADLGC